MVFLLILSGFPDQMKLKIPELRSLRSLCGGFGNTESKNTNCSIPNDLTIVILPTDQRSLIDQILKVSLSFTNFGTQLSSKISCNFLIKEPPINERYLLYNRCQYQIYQVGFTI